MQEEKEERVAVAVAVVVVVLVVLVVLVVVILIPILMVWNLSHLDQQSFQQILLTSKMMRLREETSQ